MGVITIIYCMASILHSEDKDPVRTALEQLKRPDIEIQVEAIRSLQTSLDPRIPEACLPSTPPPLREFILANTRVSLYRSFSNI